MKALNRTQISDLANRVVGTGCDDLLCSDLSGKMRYATTSACDNLGYSFEDMLTKSIADYSPTYSQNVWDDHCRRTISNGSDMMYSYHESCGGRRYPVLIHSVPHLVSETSEQLICSLVKQVQDSGRYKRMLESVEYAHRIGSFDLNFNDQSILVSDNLMAIMGASDPETLRPSEMADRLTKEDRARWNAEMINFLGGYHRMDEEFVMRTAADRQSLVRVTMWSLLNDGEVSGLSGEFQIIDESGKDQMVSLAENQRRHIIRALRYTNGRVTGPNGACNILDINGKTLFARMKKLNVKREDYHVRN